MSIGSGGDDDKRPDTPRPGSNSEAAIATGAIAEIAYKIMMTSKARCKEEEAQQVVEDQEKKLARLEEEMARQKAKEIEEAQAEAAHLEVIEREVIAYQKEKGRKKAQAEALEQQLAYIEEEMARQKAKEIEEAQAEAAHLEAIAKEKAAEEAAGHTVETDNDDALDASDDNKTEPTMVTSAVATPPAASGSLEMVAEETGSGEEAARLAEEEDAGHTVETDNDASDDNKADEPAVVTSAVATPPAASGSLEMVTEETGSGDDTTGDTFEEALQYTLAEEGCNDPIVTHDGNRFCPPEINAHNAGWTALAIAALAGLVQYGMPMAQQYFDDHCG